MRDLAFATALETSRYDDDEQRGKASEIIFIQKFHREKTLEKNQLCRLCSLNSEMGYIGGFKKVQ